MEDCIFCKIANKEIESNIVYEDNELMAVLDAFPSTLGHIIIIPKKHFKDIFEIDEEIYSKMYNCAFKIANKVKKALNCDGINILQNNEKAAGQTVFHIHTHVIPRYAGDQTCIKWPVNKPTEEDIKEFLAKL